MSCDNTGPFEGGVYTNPTVTDPTVTGGKLTDSTLSGASLTGSVTVDDTVATQLFQAIQEQDPVLVTDTAASTTGTELPTTIVGEDRTVLLGKPAGFIKLGSYMIPVFKAGS